MAAGGDGGRVVGAGGGGPFLVDFVARFGVVGGDNAAVLDHDELPLINDGRADVREAFGFVPKDMRVSYVARSAGLEREAGTFAFGHEFHNRVPFVAGDLAVFIGILIVEETGEGLFTLLA